MKLCILWRFLTRKIQLLGNSDVGRQPAARRLTCGPTGACSVNRGFETRRRHVQLLSPPRSPPRRVESDSLRGAMFSMHPIFAHIRNRVRRNKSASFQRSRRTQALRTHNVTRIKPPSPPDFLRLNPLCVFFRRWSESRRKIAGSRCDYREFARKFRPLLLGAAFKNSVLSRATRAAPKQNRPIKFACPRFSGKQKQIPSSTGGVNPPARWARSTLRTWLLSWRPSLPV